MLRRGRVGRRGGLGGLGGLVGRNGVMIFGISDTTVRQNVCHVIIYIPQNLLRGGPDVRIGSL